MHDRLQEVEHRALEKIANLETELQLLRQERDDLLEVRRQVDEEVTTLRRKVQHHEQESKNRQSVLESKIMELEHITKSLPKGASSEYIIIEVILENIRLLLFTSTFIFICRYVMYIKSI